MNLSDVHCSPEEEKTIRKHLWRPERALPPKVLPSNVDYNIRVCVLSKRTTKTGPFALRKHAHTEYCYTVNNIVSMMSGEYSRMWYNCVLITAQEI